MVELVEVDSPCGLESDIGLSTIMAQSYPSEQPLSSISGQQVHDSFQNSSQPPAFTIRTSEEIAKNRQNSTPFQFPVHKHSETSITNTRHARKVETRVRRHLHARQIYRTDQNNGPFQLHHSLTSRTKVSST